MEELFSIKVSDNADDEIWHNEAVNKKLTKYEKWFKKTKFKRGKDYDFLQRYNGGDAARLEDSLLKLDVYVDIKCDELKMLYKLRWK